MKHGVDVFDEYPVAGLLATVLLSALVYAALSYLLDGTVEVLEVAIFAVIFSIVYVAFSRYLAEE